MNDQAYPSNLDAEKALLGAILSGYPFDKAAEVVSPGDFYHPKTRAIYAAICKLVEGQKPVNAMTCRDVLKGDEAASRYIIECIESGFSLQGHSYAVMVQKAASQRAYLAAAQEIATLATTGTDAADLQAQSEALILGLSQSRNQTGAPIQFRDLIYAQVSEIAKPVEGGMIGIPTGIRALDFLTSGWRPGKLYMTVARPGGGKSAKAKGHGIHAAKAGYWVHEFSLEMHTDELGLRGLANLSGIDSNLLERREIPAQGWERISRAAQNADIPFTFDCDMYDFDRILSRARLLAKEGVKMFIFDYLLLFETRQRFERDEMRLGYFTRQLKMLAKQTNTPVLCLTQFKKEGQTKTPGKEDIYGAGQIEFNCDFIELVYDPVHCGEVAETSDYRNEETHSQIMRGIVAKHRGGKTGIVNYRFNKPISSYTEWDGPEPMDLT